MGRKPCCAKEGVNRGAWTPREDRILTTYISIHGEGKWRNLPQNAGLNRCGKSCRLRWLNYLKPDIKRGNISVEEEDLIIKLHSLLGNRWSLIARNLPGRTDNEIKNHWNTTLSKRNQVPKNETSTNTRKKVEEKANVAEPHQVIRTKALKCTKDAQLEDQMSVKGESPTRDLESPSSSSPPEDNSFDFFSDFDINDILLSDFSDLEFNEENVMRENDNRVDGDFNGTKMSFDWDNFSIPSIETLLNGTSSDDSISMDDLEAMAATLEQLNDDSEPGFNSVGSFLNLEDEWLNDKDVQIL